MEASRSVKEFLVVGDLSKVEDFGGASGRGSSPQISG
jgi:hypothetical protein